MNRKESVLITASAFLTFIVVMAICCVAAGRNIVLYASAQAHEPVQAETGAKTTAAEVLRVTALPTHHTADAELHISRTQAQLNTTTTTTVPPTYKSSGNVIVIKPNANVRTDAGADFPLVSVIYLGEKYSVIEQKDAENAVRWFLIDLGGGKRGYVCGNYVSYDGDIYGARAYLTFDDGPSNNTRKIMDILDRYGVKATFFVIYSKNNAGIYKEIVDRGHTLALHSYSHNYKTIYSSEEAYFSDLDKLSQYVYEKTGASPKYMRFPGGSSNTISKSYKKGIMTALTKRVEEKGYRYYDWNVDSGDAERNKVPADTIVKNIKNRLGTTSNAILLMHDSEVKTTTVEALPRIIEHLQAKGYAILPIDDSTHEHHHKVNN